MNKKAQSLGLTIMSVIFILIIGFTALNFLLPEVTDARNNLNCSSAATISDGTKLLCLVFDLTIPYYIWILLGVVIGSVAMRFVF